MREIWFRGQRRDTGEMVYGNLFVPIGSGATSYILAFPQSKNPAEYVCHPVISDTVGQFTGQVDNDGKPIYEGDIIRNLDGYIYPRQYNFHVKYDYGCFVGDGFLTVDCDRFSSCTVIGNIHENPELMEGNKT